ncbi:hypothetical protein [Pedobacter sp.]
MEKIYGPIQIPINKEPMFSPMCIIFKTAPTALTKVDTAKII